MPDHYKKKKKREMSWGEQLSELYDKAAKAGVLGTQHTTSKELDKKKKRSKWAK